METAATTTWTETNSQTGDFEVVITADFSGFERSVDEAKRFCQELSENVGNY